MSTTETPSEETPLEETILITIERKDDTAVTSLELTNTTGQSVLNAIVTLTRLLAQEASLPVTRIHADIAKILVENSAENGPTAVNEDD